jgi:hypothetical protein
MSKFKLIPEETGNKIIVFGLYTIIVVVFFMLIMEKCSSDGVQHVQHQVQQEKYTNEKVVRQNWEVKHHSKNYLKFVNKNRKIYAVFFIPVNPSEQIAILQFAEEMHDTQIIKEKVVILERVNVYKDDNDIFSVNIIIIDSDYNRFAIHNSSVDGFGDIHILKRLKEKVLGLFQDQKYLDYRINPFPKANLQTDQDHKNQMQDDQKQEGQELKVPEQLLQKQESSEQLFTDSFQKIEKRGWNVDSSFFLYSYLRKNIVVLFSKKAFMSKEAQNEILEFAEKIEKEHYVVNLITINKEDNIFSITISMSPTNVGTKELTITETFSLVAEPFTLNNLGEMLEKLNKQIDSL